MICRRGEVILVDYPYSDRTGSKIRPCLVVQNDNNNARLDDTIIVTISSRIQYAAEPTQLLIEISTLSGQQPGLLFTSAVQCENLLTVDNNFVRRKIGFLPPDVMLEIDKCLKNSLGIP